MDFIKVEGYLVTKEGRVFLEEEVIIGRNQVTSWEKTLPLREMRPTLDSRGYLFVKAPRRKRMWVARLVALGYVENPFNNPQVNHINGVKVDNRYSNLEWVTPTENMIHAHKLGLRATKRGEENSNSVLSNEAAGKIYAEALLGQSSQEDIASKYGVRQITVSNIKTKKSWKWLTDKLDEVLLSE